MGALLVQLREDIRPRLLEGARSPRGGPVAGAVGGKVVRRRTARQGRLDAGKASSSLKGRPPAGAAQ